MSPQPEKKATKKQRDALVSNFARHVGIVLREVREGYARAEMPITHTVVNRLETTHGGAVFTLGDKAFAAAANYSGLKTVAMNININYLRPSAVGDTLVAEAEEVRRGRRTCLYDVRIYNKRSKKLVAIMNANGFILE